MGWVLFCQIEVILLTVGLVVSFIVSMHQTAKDNSFFRRVKVLGTTISDFGKAVNDRQTDEKAKMFEQFLKVMKEKKDETK